MQITRNTTETTPGPSEWFTGTVYIDTVATPTEPSRLGAASVHFTPGARTAWHTHPLGQTIFVTEGVGLCQRRGGEIEVIRPGRSQPLHDPHSDARSRRLGQPREVGRARKRRGVRCGTAHRQLSRSVSSRGSASTSPIYSNRPTPTATCRRLLPSKTCSH